MLLFIRFPLYFTISYAILCIPISKEPIFFHLYEWTSPYFQDVYLSTLKTREFILKKGKKFTEKLFDEKKQNKIHREDSVKSHYSSTIPVKIPVKKNLHNSYSQKDKESLYRVFKEHKKTPKKNNPTQ